MRSIPNPKAIFFDWDNTLVDSRKTCLKAVNHVLSHFDKPQQTWEEFIVAPPVALHVWFVKLFGEKDWKEAAHMYNNFIAHLPVTVFPHAPLLLEWIYGQKISMGVVSNKEGFLLRKEIRILEWHHFFKSMIGASDTEANKPSGKPLLYALSRAGITPDQNVWFVGDSSIDVQCAQDAGCTPIKIHSPHIQDIFYTENTENLLCTLKKIFQKI